MNFLSSLCGGKKENTENPNYKLIQLANRMKDLVKQMEIENPSYDVYFLNEDPIMNITLSELDNIVKKYHLQITKIVKINRKIFRVTLYMSNKLWWDANKVSELKLTNEEEKIVSYLKSIMYEHIKYNELNFN